MCVFNKTIIPLALVGYEMIIANSYPTRTHGIRNDGGDGNENGKKAIGLDWQNNNFARASRLFVHFFAVAVYNVKMPNFTFCGER